MGATPNQEPYSAHKSDSAALELEEIHNYKQAYKESYQEL